METVQKPIETIEHNRKQQKKLKKYKTHTENNRRHIEIIKKHRNLQNPQNSIQKPIETYRNNRKPLKTCKKQQKTYWKPIEI